MTDNDKIKLVAEWMGWKNKGDEWFHEKHSDHGQQYPMKFDYLINYYTHDWNWIHEAWKKLYPELINSMDVSTYQEEIISGKFMSASRASNISAAFECLVEGIQLITKK